MLQATTTRQAVPLAELQIRGFLSNVEEGKRWMFLSVIKQYGDGCPVEIRDWEPMGGFQPAPNYGFSLWLKDGFRSRSPQWREAMLKWWELVRANERILSRIN